MSFSLLNAAASNRIARLWLLLGVAALAVAGLFSLVLVVARTPMLSSIPLFTRLFHEALVVHVNLSVLVWFVAIAAMLWSLAGVKTSMVEKTGFYTFGAGTLLMALSPFDPAGGALMSNYIPVIANRVFFAGLTLLFIGLLLTLGHAVAYARGEGVIGFAIRGSVFITLVAMGAFVASYLLLPRDIFEGAQYYDMLFWGGGHVLQFTHTQVQSVIWLMLAVALGAPCFLSPAWLKVLFCIGPLAAMAMVYPYVAYDITSMAFREFFTRLMIDANGITPALIGLALIFSLLGRKEKPQGQRALASALWMSFLLFAFGGVFGVLIEGQDVTIPAHYHGSIVSVTIAFMGGAYLLLPAFGYKAVAHTRLAFWQPVVYGAGQVMHITGLAWSGGYGALRKTPGTDTLPPEAVAAMGLMGGGGLIAIIGGLLFVVVVWRAIRAKR